MTVNTLDIRLLHGETEYYAKFGTIDKTWLGYEDHGIFSVNVDFDLAGSYQGTGHYAADDLFAVKFVKAMLKITDSRTWEGLPGAKVLLLYTEQYGLIRGVSDVHGTNVVIFSELAEEK